MTERGNKSDWESIRSELNRHLVRKIFKDWLDLEKALGMDEESIKGLQLGIRLADGGFKLDGVASEGEEDMMAFFWKVSEEEVFRGKASFIAAVVGAFRGKGGVVEKKKS